MQSWSRKQCSFWTFPVSVSNKEYQIDTTWAYHLTHAIYRPIMAWPWAFCQSYSIDWCLFQRWWQCMALPAFDKYYWQFAHLSCVVTFNYRIPSGVGHLLIAFCHPQGDLYDESFWTACTCRKVGWLLNIAFRTKFTCVGSNICFC